MMAYVAAYISAAVVFALADAVWLTIAGPRLYKPAIGELLSGKVNLTAAVIFYLMYVAGIVALAINPAFKDGSVRTAAVGGLILGVVAYGTYDLTNQATLKVWATRLTIADMTWGGMITALAATVGFLVATRMGLVGK